MNRRARVLAFVLLVGLAIAAPAHAQTPFPTTSVRALVDALFQPGDPFNPSNEPLLSADDYFRRQQDSLEGIAIGLGTALASFPLGASSAGFAYVIDPTSKQSTLKSVSFGPTFVERALTNGRGVLNLGVSFQFSSFDTLQGVDLKTDGFPVQSQIGTYLLDGVTLGDSWRATLDVKSRTFIFAGSYGVTDHLDVGWAIPIASIEATGRLMRDYDAARDYDAFPQVQPLYPNRAGTLVQSEGIAKATGIGDMVVRGKFAFGPPTRQMGMVSAELRLPTGDEEDLLGTGKTSFRLIGGGTRVFGVGSVNVNGGFTVGGLTDEFNFSAGTDVALLARKQLTLTFDVISQTLRDAVTSVETLVSDDRVSIGAPELSRRRVVQYGFWDRGTTTLLRAAAGAKYAVGGEWLLTGSGLFRLNDNGYQAKLVAIVGLERTWVRR